LTGDLVVLVGSGTAGLRQSGWWCRLPGAGRVKSDDLDFSLSGEHTGAADGLAQSFARTRPVPAFRALEKRTVAAFFE